METGLAAFGIPCVCQNCSLLGHGGKVCRHVYDAMHFLTQPSSRLTGIVHFETSVVTHKFTARFCLGEMYWFMFPKADGSICLLPAYLLSTIFFKHTNLFVIFFPLKVWVSIKWGRDRRDLDNIYWNPSTLCLCLKE